VQNKFSIGNTLATLLQSTWYKRGLLWFLISALLWPLSQIYKFLAYTHRQLYKFGILQVNKVSVPIIVVGNIVAGGGGKTPTVIALVQHLQAQGIQVGVISRGYGRSSAASLEVTPESAISDVGDEPASILLACNAIVFVANTRHQAASALLEAYPATQVIISDDGLQHHALQHDIAITVFDDRGIGNGLMLPAGPLREATVKPLKSLVLHTGNHPVDLKSKLPKTTAPQFTASRALASYALRSDCSQISLEALKITSKPLLALAGIANPEAFFEMLRSQGLHLTDTIPMPDHADYRYLFNSYSGNKYAGYTLICTIKDAVKLWQLENSPFADVLAVPLAFAPEASFFTAFDAMLKPSLKSETKMSL
jgi:tetraacyldisaccharide 4'-kinase